MNPARRILGASPREIDKHWNDRLSDQARYTASRIILTGHSQTISDRYRSRAHSSVVMQLAGSLAAWESNVKPVRILIHQRERERERKG